MGGLSSLISSVAQLTKARKITKRMPRAVVIDTGLLAMSRSSAPALFSSIDVIETHPNPC